MPSITREHQYTVDVQWLGNTGTGTSGYRTYSRDCEVRADGPAPIAGSSDRAFRGDPRRWNPEQLLLAATAQCHMLAYLHHAADSGVVVTGYEDRASAVLTENGTGGGRITSIVLRPVVTVASADQIERAVGLHGPAGRDCFIAASLAVPITHEPTTLVAQP